MHLAQIYKKIAHYIDIDAPTANADRNGVAIIAVLKNQSKYIKEWIRYHSLIGVKSIYLYDIDSSDETFAIAQDFAKEVNINLEIIPWLFDNISLRRSFTTLDEHVMAYCHAFCTHGGKYRWMTPMTTDEFIVIKENENINDCLDSLNKFVNISVLKKFFPYQTDSTIVFDNTSTHELDKNYLAFNFFVDPCNVTQVGVNRISTKDMELTTANEDAKVIAIKDRNQIDFAANNKIQINKYLTFLDLADKKELQAQLNSLKINRKDFSKYSKLNKKIIANPQKEEAIISYLAKCGVKNKTELLEIAN